MRLFSGNNLDILKTLESDSIDSVVTDPPYGLSFMNKKWDHDVPSVEFWREVLRVLKPGGHVLSFGGTRTYHRMAVNIEDAGFEIRDQIMWLYGSGFPKSHNISKGIDKKLGCEREVIGVSENNRDRSKHNYNSVGNVGSNALITNPAHDLAKKYDGFGTALKPANEPIVLARKPFKGTVVDNVLKHGTGGLNIDGCKIEYQSEADKSSATPQSMCASQGLVGDNGKERNSFARPEQTGRWPANVILDEEAGAMLDEQSGISKSSSATRNNGPSKNTAMSGDNLGHVSKGHDDAGGASRFFYCAKASKSERNKGLEGMPLGEPPRSARSKPAEGRSSALGQPRQNHHPTVKPIKLMEYLIKLITPPNGVVLDPFMGSGSTGVAAKNLGFDFIGMELDKDYFEIARRRIYNGPEFNC